MKVAVDFQSTQGQRTGIGVSAHYLVQEIRRLAPEIDFFLFTSKKSSKDLRTFGRIFWESVRIPLRTFKKEPDLVYSPGFAPALFNFVPRVVTVHDLIGMVYPKNLPWGARFYWSFWLPLCVKRARTVVASSESTRRDIERLLGIPPKKIPVVPLAAAPVCERLPNEEIEQKGIDAPFFLSVSTLEPRKNIAGLIRAFAAFKKKASSPCQLFIAGKCGGESEKVKKIACDLGLEREIRWLGYVPDEELVFYTNASLGYVCVSFYEGFGLPVLEAMKCGKSGICSNVSSLPEIVQQTGLYVDPANEADIAEKMHIFYTDKELRDRLSRAALERAAFFNWTRAAQLMIEIFKKSR